MSPQTISLLFFALVLIGSLEGNGVQMQRDVQCCMQYSQGKIRTKDVLKYEVQTAGPDCSIQAIIVYTKRVVKCADPRDRKVQRLLKKLARRQSARKNMWLHPSENLPALSDELFWSREQIQ